MLISKDKYIDGMKILKKDQKYAQDFKNSLKSFLVKTKIIFKAMKMAKITTR